MTPDKLSQCRPNNFHASLSLPQLFFHLVLLRARDSNAYVYEPSRQTCSQMDTTSPPPPRPPPPHGLLAIKTPCGRDQKILQGLQEDVQGLKGLQEDVQGIKSELKRRRSSAGEEGGSGSRSRHSKARRRQKSSPFRAGDEMRDPSRSPPPAPDSDQDGSCSGERSSSDGERSRRAGSMGYRDAHHPRRRLSAPARGGGAMEQGYYPYGVSPGAYTYAAPPPVGYYHYAGGPPPHPLQGAAPGYPAAYPGYGIGGHPTGLPTGTQVCGSMTFI